MKVIVGLLAYSMLCTAFALCVIYSMQMPVANQYCLVASFYIGFIGSIFITNLLRIVMNALLVGKVGQCKCLKMLLAAEVFNIW